jgi:energy-coupling factor transport system substrate-specific component
MTNASQRTGQGGVLSRVAADFTTRAWVLIPIGVGINFVVGTLVNALQLPIFLDTIGTILVAIMAGPWVGALTGLMSSLVIGITSPASMAFAPTSIAIGLVAGFLVLHGMFRSYPRTLVSGVILALTGVIVSSPIVVLVFGGAGGSPGQSAVTAFLLATGANLWRSVVTSQLLVAGTDKVISVFVAVIIARAIPERYRPQKARQTL